MNPCLARYLQHREEIVGALDWTDDLLAAVPAQALEVGTIDTAEVVVPLTAAIRAELGDQVRVINTQSLLGEGQYLLGRGLPPRLQQGHRPAAPRRRPTPSRPARIVAIGDNYNDLDMFAEAGVSVAMSDGPARRARGRRRRHQQRRRPCSRPSRPAPSPR